MDEINIELNENNSQPGASTGLFSLIISKIQINIVWIILVLALIVIIVYMYFKTKSMQEQLDSLTEKRNDKPIDKKQRPQINPNHFTVVDNNKSNEYQLFSETKTEKNKFVEEDEVDDKSSKYDIYYNEDEEI
jgi:Ca2+/Na+ antiporter